MSLKRNSKEDRSKFESIYKEHRDLMYGVAHKILKDREMAEDAVHNAFIKIYNHLDKIGDISSHKTKSFLIVVARTCALDIYNQQKSAVMHEDALVEDDTEVDKEDVGIDIEKMLIDADTLHELLDMIKRIKTIYADTFMLKYYNDFTDNEIAEILNIAHDTVRKRISRARKLLAKVVERSNYE